jgi:hypothetical protein
MRMNLYLWIKPRLRSCLWELNVFFRFQTYFILLLATAHPLLVNANTTQSGSKNIEFVSLVKIANSNLVLGYLKNKDLPEAISDESKLRTNLPRLAYVDVSNKSCIFQIGDDQDSSTIGGEPIIGIYKNYLVIQDFYANSSHHAYWFLLRLQKSKLVLVDAIDSDFYPQNILSQSSSKRLLQLASNMKFMQAEGDGKIGIFKIKVTRLSDTNQVDDLVVDKNLKFSHPNYTANHEKIKTHCIKSKYVITSILDKEIK